VEPLVITNGAPGEFSIRASTGLELSNLAEIEARSVDGHWVPYRDLDAGNGFRVVTTCDSAARSCRTLSPGDQLNLAAWSGGSCSAQCAAKCRVDSFHPGVHRLVLYACDDEKTRYEGPAFEMPESARELSRLRAAANIQKGTIFRLDPLRPKASDESHPPEHITGFRVVEGSARPLTAELLPALSAWLRRRDAFVQYDVNKRCFQGHLVGLLLERSAMLARGRNVEVALNLACNSVFISTTDGRGKSTEVSHFDPSWSEVMAFVRRALPLDAELARLEQSPTNLPAKLEKSPDPASP
jgi:hypothetical protein